LFWFIILPDFDCEFDHSVSNISCFSDFYFSSSDVTILLI